MSFQGWISTHKALEDLEDYLNCPLCGQPLNDPCSFKCCDQYFCRQCATDVLNATSKCPECESFAWVKDLQTNRQLANTVSFCLNLRRIVGHPSNGSKSCNEENEIPGNSSMQEVLNGLSKSVEGRKEQFLDAKYDLDDKGFLVNAADTSNVNNSDNNINFRNKDDDDNIGNDKNSTCTDDDDSDGNIANEGTKLNESDGENEDPELDDQETEKLKRKFKDWTLSQTQTQKKKKYSKKLMKTYGKTKDRDEIFRNYEKLSEQSNYLVYSEVCLGGNGNENDIEDMDVNGDMDIDGDGDEDEDDHQVDEDYNVNYGQKKHAQTGKGRIRRDRTKSDGATSVQNKQGRNTRLRRKSHGVNATVVTTDEDDMQEDQDLFKISGARSKIATKTKGKKCNSSEVVETPLTAVKTVTLTPKIARTKSVASPLAKLMKKNKKGETPLHVASIKGDLAKAKELLCQGVEPNVKDFAGWTPLHEACNRGRLDMVDLLLENGAFIDIPGYDHDTPLHDAVANNRLDVARLLVSRGASLRTRNKQGLLPSDYARTTAMLEVLTTSMFGDDQMENRKDLMPALTVVSSSTKKKLVSTGLNGGEKKALGRCAKLLSAELVEDFDLEVTHVISAVDQDNVCSRTMKYVMGVLTGKWIVTSQWIKDSLKQNCWVNEEKYEIKGTYDCTDNIPRKARLNAFKQFPGLFDGCSFFFSGDFKDSVPSKNEIIQLIQAGDGTILLREPKAESAHPLITPASPAVMKMMSTKMPESPSVTFHAKPDTGHSHCTQFILYNPNSKHEHKRISTPILCTAPTTWVMDCISHFEIVEVRDH